MVHANLKKWILSGINKVLYIKINIIYISFLCLKIPFNKK